MAGEDGLGAWLGLFQANLMGSSAIAGLSFAEKASKRCRAALFRDGQWLLDYVRLRVVASKD